MKKNDKTKKRKYAKNADLNLESIPSSNRKMNYFKKKRTQNRIRTTISRTHAFLKILSILLLFWLSSRLMICSFWYLPENIFDVYPSKHLKIIGNKITPNTKVIWALKKIPLENKPLYLINTIPFEEEIEKLSPIKKAFVRRYWLPARFEVTLEEEIPVLTLAPAPNAPEIAAITTDGKVITREYLPIKTNFYKTYKVLTYDDYSKWSKKEILSLKVLAQRIEDYSQEKLVYLDIRNKNDVFAQLDSIKIRIGELNSTLKERVERLSSIMPQIENLKQETDYVDIRWDNTTYLKKKSKAIPKLNKEGTNNTINLPKKTPVVIKKTVKKVVEIKKEPLKQQKIQPQKPPVNNNEPPPLPEIKIDTIEAE